MRQIIGLFSLLFVSANPAYAAFHTYKIQQIAVDIAGCSAVQGVVAAKFTEVTGAKILSRACERNPGRSADLIIDYASDVALEFVTTYGEFGGVHGLYDSLQDCSTARNSEVNDFRKLTGLEPVVAFCYRDYLQFEGDLSWTLRIDAFGTPALSPHAYRHSLVRLAVADHQLLEASLRNALAAAGAIKPAVRVRVTGENTTINAQYYGVQALQTFKSDTGHFPSISDCLAEGKVMTAVHSRAGAQEALNFCATASYSTNVQLYTMAVTSMPIGTQLTGVGYISPAECDLQRPTTEQAWRDGLGLNIIGAVCATDDQSFTTPIRMRMFWLVGQ